MITICKEVDSKIKSAGRHTTVFNSSLRNKLYLKNKITLDDIDVFLSNVLDNNVNQLKKRFIKIHNTQKIYAMQEINILKQLDVIFMKIKETK